MSIKKFLAILHFQLFGWIKKTSTIEENKAILPTADLNKPVVYPKEFIEKAEKLLRIGLLYEYAQLLNHNYQPSNYQQKMWNDMIGTEIKNPESTIVKQLIKESFNFSSFECWQLFTNKNEDFLTKIATTYQEQIPYILSQVVEETKELDYSFSSLNLNYPATLTGILETKIDIFRFYLDNLKNMVPLLKVSQSAKASEDFLWSCRYHIQQIEGRCGEKVMKDPCFAPMKRYLNTLSKLQDEVLHFSKDWLSKPDELEDMKKFLKTQNVGKTIESKVKELRLQKINTKEKLPTSIQNLLNEITKSYEQTSNIPDSAIQFEVKNLIEKSVPELLEAYLSFPIEHRNTLKNNNQETAEDILLKSLQHQKDIIKNFEAMALEQKFKSLTVLETYAHNKKMSLNR